MQHKITLLQDFNLKVHSYELCFYKGFTMSASSQLTNQQKYYNNISSK